MANKKKYYQKKQKRIKSAYITCNKYDRLNNYAKKIMNRIKIDQIDNPVKAAIDHYNLVNATELTDTSKVVLRRIVLNYLRHNHSNYDQVVKTMRDISFDHKLFKEKVNLSIFDKNNLIQYFDRPVENDYIHPIITTSKPKNL